MTMLDWEAFLHLEEEPRMVYIDVRQNSHALAYKQGRPITCDQVVLRESWIATRGEGDRRYVS